MPCCAHPRQTYNTVLYIITDAEGRESGLHGLVNAVYPAALATHAGGLCRVERIV